MDRILDLVPVGLYRASLDGRIIQANPALAHLLGYPGTDDLVQIRTIDTYVDPADRERLIALVKEHGTARVEVRLRRLDGSIFHADIWTRLVTDDGDPYFAGMVNDVTMRRESDLLFRRVFDQLPVGTALLSIDGRFNRINPALCRMLGRTEEELRGMTFLDITHPDDRPMSVQQVRELLAGQIDHIEMEKRYLRGDGEMIWGYVSVRLIRDTEGRPLWTMPVVIDITERRRLEEQFRQAQKMEAVGQLAGGLAHDFNNILTAIIGYSEMLLEQVGADKPMFADLNQIYEGGRRAAAHTQPLRAFSRKQVMQVEVVDLNQVLVRFQHLARPLIGEQIRLELDLSREPMPILADATQLEQVVMNLLVNSRDAMPEGGRVIIRTSPAVVDEEFARTHHPIRPGDYIELVVEDSGTGMSEDTKRHLFEPFFTTKQPGKGTGLGLATVFGIVKQMGGFVWVTTALGRGTLFRIQFPRPTEHVHPGSQLAGAGASSVGHERILLVEDDPNVRQFARTVLTRYGYRVSEAGQATDALDQLHAGARWPDLLMTDIVLPGMSGRELAKLLRAERPTTRVLFTSGYIENRVTPGGRLERGMDLLEKPFTATELLRRVRDILDDEPGTLTRETDHARND
ncbi:MAG: PAS domain S-box protein [Acidobacteriota bacterium]